MLGQLAGGREFFAPVKAAGKNAFCHHLLDASLQCALPIWRKVKGFDRNSHDASLFWTYRERNLVWGHGVEFG
jgi:hypothetical protein